MAAEPETRALPAAIAEIDVGRAAVPLVVGAVDAALASGLEGLRVRVPLAADDGRRPALEALCGSDPRVAIVEPGATAPPVDIFFNVPAAARPQRDTLGTLAATVRSEGLASVEVPVPGRLGLGRGRLRVTAGGSGSRRLRAAEVGLRSATSRRSSEAPEPGTLAEERAEHLRHRARASTMRARMDRNAHRLSRERLQTRHERARLHLAEEQLGRSGAGEWVRWRSRAVARRAAGVPAVTRSLTRSARNTARRGWRFGLDRWRTRGGGTA